MNSMKGILLIAILGLVTIMEGEAQTSGANRALAAGD